MRVVVVSGEYPPDIGGTATHAALLTEHLPQRGHDIRVLTLWNGPGVGGRGEQILRYPRGWSWPLRFSAIIWWLVKHRHSYDTIYSTSLHPAAAIGGRLARRPYILHVPGDQVWERAVRLGITKVGLEDFQEVRGGPRVGAMRALRRWTLRHATAIDVCSDYLGEIVNRWAGVPPPIHTVPIGVRPMRHMKERAADRTHFHATYVGRLVTHKRVDLVIHAASLVDGLTLEIIGEGPLAGDLERQCSELDLGGRVTFTGALDHDEVLERLWKADVLVLASESEPLGQVAVEALICGTPVIAPRVGGLPEVITEGKTGLLIDEPTADRIAHALTTLRDDPDLLGRMSSRGRQIAGRWSIEASLSKVEDLLHYATARRSQTRLRVAIGEDAKESPRRVVSLGLFNPSYVHMRARDPIRECLRHYALEWLLDDDWRIEFWGLRSHRQPGRRTGGIREIGPRVSVRLPIPLQVALATLVQLLLAIGRPRPGIIVAPMPLFGAGVAVAKAIRRAQGPFVVRIIARTSSSARRVKRSWVRYHVIEAVERFVLRQADLVLPLGDFTRGIAEDAGVPPERIICVPAPPGSPKDLQEVPPISDRYPPHVAFAGRFVPEKAIDVLLRAIAQIVEEFPDVMLDLAGDGVERTSLEKLAADLGITYRVRWHGYLPITDMSTFYQAATIVVMPSRSEEGMCRALVEAGLAGCGLIASDLGGLRDVVRHGSSGILVASEDADALADAIRSLLRSPAETQRLADGARARALEIYELRDTGLAELQRRFNDYASSRGYQPGEIRGS